VLAGTETILGPLYFGYGYAEDSQGLWYFCLGQQF